MNWFDKFTDGLLTITVYICLSLSLVLFAMWLFKK